MSSIATLVLVLYLAAVANFQKTNYAGDYYIAAFALLFYGVTQITTLGWLSLLFVLAGMYNIFKGKYGK